MASKRNFPEVPLSVPKMPRSRFNDPQGNYGAISSPTPATMTSSTRVTATATGEAILTGTPAPVAKGKRVATCSAFALKGLVDVTSTDRAILTFVHNINIYERGREKLLEDLNKASLIYASGQEKLLQDFNKAMLYYVSAEKELARELKMGTAEVLSSYAPVK